MTTSNPDRTVGAGLPTIRDEVLRSQLRPVIALAFTAALLVGSAILGQYAWLRLQATNPLDEIDAAELRQVLRSASLDQWPVLTRWVAAFGLGMTVGPGDDVPAGQARLTDSRQVPLADVLCLVVDGQRVEPASGRLLGPAPANWQAAIARMDESATLRLGPTDSADSAGPQSWPALLLRLDPGRVAVVASPDFAFAPSELARLVLLFAALTAAAVAAFVALFLLAFRRRFAARSAERLSAPVERLAAAVRMATADSAAARRVVVEPPAEVAQLAADFNRMQEHLAQAPPPAPRGEPGYLNAAADHAHRWVHIARAHRSRVGRLGARRGATGEDVRPSRLCPGGAEYPVDVAAGRPELGAMRVGC